MATSQAATLKHWVAYDFEGYQPRTDTLPRPASAGCDTPLQPEGGCSRYNLNAKVSDRDLHGYFMPSFLAAIEAGARSVMCSYNALNGTPVCAHPLLEQTGRQRGDRRGLAAARNGGNAHPAALVFEDFALSYTGAKAGRLSHGGRWGPYRGRRRVQAYRTLLGRVPPVENRSPE